MSRRRFLKVMGGSAFAAACSSHTALVAGGTTAPTGLEQRGLRAIAFDLFTIFDPRLVDQRVATLLNTDAAFAKTWKSRLFEYSWIRAASGRYVDFEQLVRDALQFAARVHGLTITEAVQTQLANTFTELKLWPDSLSALQKLRSRGLSLTPLANFSPSMIEQLLTQGQIRDLFATIISTDEARSYKPDPRAYGLAEAKLGLQREQIAFAAFGGWDAAGAAWYGFPTFWVNRLGVPQEELHHAATVGPDLDALAVWALERRAEPDDFPLPVSAGIDRHGAANIKKR